MRKNYKKITYNFFIIFIFLTSSIFTVVSQDSTNTYPCKSSDEIIQNASEFLYSKQNFEGSIVGISTSAWAAIALSSIDNDTVQFQRLKQYLIDITLDLDQQKATEWERHTLALMACDLDPRNVNGINLTEKLYSFFDGIQMGDENNIFDDVFGILALISTGMEKNSQIIIQLKKHVSSKQQSDGGWGDVDSTAGAIMALISAGELNTSEIINEALLFLKSKQDNSGSFIAYGSANIASTSWAINALIATGENPLSDEWKNENNTSIDFILSLQQEDGSFNYSKTQQMNSEWMTSYAIMALLGKTYPTTIFKKDNNEQDDSPPDPEDEKDNEEPNDEQNGNDEENSPLKNESKIIFITYPRHNGLYIWNQHKQKLNDKIIVIGNIDIRVKITDEVDIVRFFVENNIVFEDNNPPFLFQLNTPSHLKRINIRVEAIKYNKTVNIIKIEKLLLQILDEIKSYNIENSISDMINISRYINEIEKSYIDEKYITQLNMTYMNKLANKKRKIEEFL